MKKGTALHGVITALLTPFDSSGRPDEGAMSRLVAFQLDKGVHGVFPLGTTGTGLLMTREERMKVADLVISEVSDRVPVVVHTGAMDTATTVELSKHAEKAGADAVSCITPFFFRSDDATMVRHFKEVSNAVRLPVFAYNNPKASGVNISMSALQSLSTSGTISGLKDSSRDFLRLLDCVESLPKGFTILNGTESYALPALLIGVKGMISAVANIIPELMLELYDYYMKGEYESALKVQRKVNKVKKITDEHGLGALFVILRKRGVECGLPRAPVFPLSGQESDIVLEKWKRVQAV